MPMADTNKFLYDGVGNVRDGLLGGCQNPDVRLTDIKFPSIIDMKVTLQLPIEEQPRESRKRMRVHLNMQFCSIISSASLLPSIPP